MRFNSHLVTGILIVLGVVRPAPAEEAELVYKDNVVIVVDGSGSMKEPMKSAGMTRLKAAKQALHEVLSRLPDSTNVGLIVFSAKIKKPWIYPLGPRDSGRLKAAIDGVKASGTTPLGDFIKRATDRLLEQRAKQFGYGSYRLLIVTDGHASDQADVNRFAPEIISRGVTMDVIGVDMDQDHTLKALAHSYRRADDPESLKQAIAEVMAEVGGGSGDQKAGEDVFDVLAPIPPEIATAMIEALSSSGNHPIGAPVQSASSTVSSSTSYGAPVKSGFLGETLRAIVGACVGLCVIVVLAAVGFYLVRRRLRGLM